MKTHWECELCKNKYIFNIDEITKHRKDHEIADNNSGNTKLQDLEKEYEKQLYKEGKKSNDSNNNSNDDNGKESVGGDSKGRTRYLCEDCDRYYLFTPPEILRHRKTHTS